MTVSTANIVVNTTGGSDIIAFGTAIFSNIAAAKFTATSITVTGANGDQFILKGSFTYTGTPDLSTFTGGTTIGAKLIDNPGAHDYATLSGVSINAAAAVDALLHHTVDDFLALLGPISFHGNSGDDIGLGAGLDDTIQGGAGADTMSGGGGNDTLSYSDSSFSDAALGKVNVNLATGAASGGDAAGDIFSGFENLTGSDYNDKLTGSAGANIINGRLGNDILIGGAGADTLIGGGGTDTADYSGSNAAVQVDLSSGLAATGGHAQGDILTLIENQTGSSFGDTLTGNSQVNTLVGGGGNDTLDGGLNNDRLDGGSGNDRLIGGQGIDTEYGRGGADTFVLSNAALGADKIMDYTVGSDKLEINAALFHCGLVAGVDLTDMQVEVNTNGEAHSASTRFILDTTTGELFCDVNGSVDGTTGSRLIATLHGTLAGFSHSDFDIV